MYQNHPKNAYLSHNSDNTTYTFTMPAENVTVSAVFESTVVPKQQYKTTINATIEGQSDIKVPVFIFK